MKKHVQRYREIAYKNAVHLECTDLKNSYGEQQNGIYHKSRHRRNDFKR